MALLVTKQNRPLFVTAKQGNYLWRIKTGEVKGDPKERAKAAQIAKWYLNRDTAPKSYVDTHPPLTAREHEQERPVVPQYRLPYID